MSSTLATNSIASRRLEVIIIGPPGTSKTVTAHQMPRTRTLDFDNGMQSVEWAIRAGHLKKKPEEIVYATIQDDMTAGGHVTRSTAFDDATDQVTLWLKEEKIPDEKWDKPYEKEWDTLIIDSGSSFSDICLWKGLDESARLGLSKSKSMTKPGGITVMRMQDWGAATSLFQKFINWARSIDKNLVLLCHEYPNTDEEGKIISYDPLLIGQLRQKITKDFDEVWYARVEGSMNKPRYVFQTAPDPLRRCRSRLGCFDAKEDANFDEMRKKVAAFYNIPEDELWTTKR